jgi:hypothetical protein
MARRNKPKTPEQIAAEKIAKRGRDLEAVNLPADGAILDKQSDIDVTRAGQKREGQKVDGDSARRLDAFAALKDGMAPGAYDSARRFELAIAVRRGEADRGIPTERVDRTAGHVTDTMISAAEEVEAVVDRLPPRDWWLLMELIAPSVPRESWRASVAFITGETHAHAQGAAVRCACVNLRDAYLAWERKEAA